MASSFRRRSGSGRARRPMDWEYSLVQVGAVAAAGKASAFVVLPSELNAEYTDPTLMATRLVSSVLWAAGSTYGGAAAWGLIAWDDINDTPPVGAECPGPFTNGNLDWIMRQVHPNAGAATGSLVQPGDNTVVAKSRRRLGTSRGILAVLETNSAGTLSGAYADVRCLIKE